MQKRGRTGACAAVAPLCTTVASNNGWLTWRMPIEGQAMKKEKMIGRMCAAPGATSDFVAQVCVECLRHQCSV